MGRLVNSFLRTLSVYHGVLRDVELNVARREKQFQIQDVVIGTDANVEVEPGVSHKSLAVSGPSVGGVPSVPRLRNGEFLKKV
eukprot:5475372-Pyramimonas_sp.AAC.1